LGKAIESYLALHNFLRQKQNIGRRKKIRFFRVCSG
jgi:hypothetical protein